MGTPTAVSYSNIFLFGIESRILPFYPYSYFTRYIDDVFAIFHDEISSRSFVTAFNSVCDSIKFEEVTHQRSGVMLDMEYSLTPLLPLPSTLDKVIHKLFQKPRNIYQYIPTISEHKPSIFTNFVFQELKRYLLACTDYSDFVFVVAQFSQRLLVRGYPPTILQEAFLKLPTRISLMNDLRARTLPQPGVPKVRKPIISICIPRLDPLINWQEIFQIPDRMSSKIFYRSAFNSSDVIIGARNPPTIGSYIIRSKFRT